MRERDNEWRQRRNKYVFPIYITKASICCCYLLFQTLCFLCHICVLILCLWVWEYAFLINWLTDKYCYILNSFQRVKCNLYFHPLPKFKQAYVLFALCRAKYAGNKIFDNTVYASWHSLYIIYSWNAISSWDSFQMNRSFLDMSEFHYLEQT